MAVVAAMPVARTVTMDWNDDNSVKRCSHSALAVVAAAAAVDRPLPDSGCNWQQANVVAAAEVFSAGRRLDCSLLATSADTAKLAVGSGTSQLIRRTVNSVNLTTRSGPNLSALTLEH